MIARLSLVLFACAIVLPLSVACGGDSTPKTIRNVQASSTAITNDPSAAPVSEMPVSRFALALEDLDTSVFRTDVSSVLDLTTDVYATSTTFDSSDQGKQLLTKWGYEGGYEAGYLPIGSTQAVLNGAYYVNVELHLFKDADGAKEAYTYFDQRILKGKAQAAAIAQVGNQSAGYTTDAGALSGATVDAVADRILFRRGNVVSVVFVYGAKGFVTIDTARQLAMVEDNKILGKQRAPVPTPVSNFTPATGTGQGIPPTPTAAASAAATTGAAATP